MHLEYQMKGELRGAKKQQQNRQGSLMLYLLFVIDGVSRRLLDTLKMSQSTFDNSGLHCAIQLAAGFSSINQKIPKVDSSENYNYIYPTIGFNDFRGRHSRCIRGTVIRRGSFLRMIEFPQGFQI